MLFKSFGDGVTRRFPLPSLPGPVTEVLVAAVPVSYSIATNGDIIFAVAPARGAAISVKATDAVVSVPASESAAEPGEIRRYTLGVPAGFVVTKLADIVTEHVPLTAVHATGFRTSFAICGGKLWAHLSYGSNNAALLWVYDFTTGNWSERKTGVGTGYGLTPAIGAITPTKILIAAPYEGGSQAYIFDTTTEQLVQVASMDNVHYYCLNKMAVLDNGRALVFGDDFGSYTTYDEYDYPGNDWSSGTILLNGQPWVFRGCVCAIPGNKAALFYEGKLAIFDYATKQCTQIATTTARAYCQLAYYDGQVYIIGGQGAFENKISTYHLASGTWSNLSDTPVKAENCGAVADPATGFIYHGFGGPNNFLFEKYRIASYVKEARKT